MLSVPEVNGVMDMKYTRLVGVYNASEVATKAKKAFLDAENEHLSKGVEGSNKEQREANLAIVLAGEQSALDAAEAALREAKHKLELAQVDVDRVRYLLRLDELSARPRA